MEQHRRGLPYLGRPGLGAGPRKGAIVRARDDRPRDTRACLTAPGAKACADAYADAYADACADACDAAARPGRIARAKYATGGQTAAAPRVACGHGHQHGHNRRRRRKSTEHQRTITANSERAQWGTQVGLADRPCRSAPAGAGRRNSFIGAIRAGRASGERRARGLRRQRSARLRKFGHHQTRRQLAVRVCTQPRDAGARRSRSRRGPSNRAHGGGGPPVAGPVLRNSPERQTGRSSAISF
jgi:hypothetical protein